MKHRIARAVAAATIAATAAVVMVAADVSSAHRAGAVAPYYSETSREGSIYRLYRSYFLREPDRAGFATWYVYSVSGWPLERISQAFAQSSEFRNRYGALSDPAFVDLVYRNVLGRPADAGGESYWSTQLARGVSRGSVMVRFSDSSEYRSKTRLGVPPGYRAGSNARVLLETLTVAAEPVRSGYDRSLFQSGWDDEDHDACDTRCEVLASEKRADGTWFSLWDGYSTPNAGELQIDHVVALAEAWDSGAKGWTATQRDRFTDWTVNLTAVTAATNTSKSDRDAAQWFPPRAASNCVFAEVTITTKAVWKLSVDPAEKRALGNMLNGCGSTTSNPPPVVTRPPTTTRPSTTTRPPSGCRTDGIYRAANGGCVANFEDGSGDVDCGQLPAAYKPVAVLNPSNDPYRLDGNNDGVGCEAG